MTFQKKIIAVMVIALALVSMDLRSLFAVKIKQQQPIDVIRSVGDRVLAILTVCPPKLTPEIKKKRREEVVKIVYDFVDFEEMAKRTLGRYWKKEPEAKRKEFVALFEKLLYNTYVDRIDAYSCKQQKILYEGQEIRGRYALVKTRVVGDKDMNFTVEYRLKLKNGQWKAYDVVIEGVSFVSNYRTQFSSILINKSFDQLLDQMRQKIAVMEKKQQE